MSCVLIFYLLWELGLKEVKNLYLFLQDTKVRVTGKRGCVSAQGLQYLCAFSFFVYFNTIRIFLSNVGILLADGTSLSDPLPLDLLPW